MLELKEYEEMFKLCLFKEILEEYCKEGFKIRRIRDGRMRLGVCTDMVSVPEEWVEDALKFLAEGVLIKCRKENFNC